VEQIRASNGDAKIVMLATHQHRYRRRSDQRGATHFAQPVRPKRSDRRI
jgi:hypothetical protein